MKNRIFMTFLIGLSIAAKAQDTLQTGQSGDIFMDFVRKIYFTNRMSFHAEIRKKNLFETDTSVSEGIVCLRKTGDSVTFIFARDKLTSENMIFERDSLWYMAPGDTSWKFLCKGIEGVKASKAGIYVPLDFLTIAYADGKYVPYWKVTGMKGDLETVSLYIGSKPPEISKLETQIEISRKDTLPYRIRYIAVFEAYDDNIFQETILSNTVIPATTEWDIIGEVYDYPREIRNPMDSKSVAEAEENETGSAQVLPLKELNLENMDGTPFHLPEEGLAFIDFWYAGCYPCMKAAPILEKLYHSYRDRLLFLSMNELDRDKEKIIRFQQKMELTCPVLLNRGDQLTSKISGANAYPLFVILDLKTRQCLWYLSGFADNLEEVMEQAIIDSLR